MCGGTDPCKALGRGYRGLSPRVRGNLYLESEREDNDRTIPACAGEPFCMSVLQGILKDYPRVCGGTRNLHLSSPSLIELSPRVRGNPISLDKSGILHRTIPACAGEPVGYRGKRFLA